MLNLLLESIFVGFITLVIGTIIFNLSINKINKDNKNNKDTNQKPYGFSFAFFITGVLLHIGLEFLGFNKWYCNKKTLTGICRLSELGTISCRRY